MILVSVVSVGFVMMLGMLLVRFGSWKGCFDDVSSVIGVRLLLIDLRNVIDSCCILLICSSSGGVLLRLGSWFGMIRFWVGDGLVGCTDVD